MYTYTLLKTLGVGKKIDNSLNDFGFIMLSKVLDPVKKEETRSSRGQRK